MGIRPQGALVLNHFGTVELVRKKTILGFREGETSLERAIAAEKVSDCLRGGVCVCVCVCVCAQLCLTLCNPMGYSPPASSVHGILQTRILEWVAISFSRGIIPYYSCQFVCLSHPCRQGLHCNRFLSPTM